MVTDPIYLVQGDQLPVLRFELKDASRGTQGKSSTWPPLDLTGATVEARLIRRKDRQAAGNLIVFIEDAAQGKGFAEWGDLLTEPGGYEVEISALFDGDKRLTVHDRQSVTVRARD